MKKTMIAVLVSLMVVGCSGNGDDANKEWKPVTGPVHYTDDIAGHYVDLVNGFSVDIKSTTHDSYIIEVKHKSSNDLPINVDIETSLKKMKSDEDFYTKGKFTWYGQDEHRVDFTIHDDVGLRAYQSNYELGLRGIVPSSIFLKKVY